MKRPFPTWTEENKQSFEFLRKKVADKYGIDKIYPASARYFPSYTIMVAIVSCLQIFTVLYGDHNFKFLGMSVSTGWFFLLPIVQYIFQIVTEVYGWEYAKQLVLCNFIVNGLASIIYYAFHLIPVFSQDYGDAAKWQVSLYDVGLSVMYMRALSMWLGIFFADYITCLLMSWSKFEMGGKHMIMRVFVLHIISEILLQAPALIVDPLYGITLSSSFHLIIESMVGRFIIMLALLPVASWVINFLQYKVEKVVVCDVERDLSPFKFKITQFQSFYINSDEINKAESANKMFDKRDMKEMLELYKKEFGEDYSHKG